MKLKICGLKNEKNVRQLLQLQPDYLGFIFYHKSPRYVGSVTSRETAKNRELDWIRAIPEEFQKAGVFVNEVLEIVIRTAEILKLQVVQLHGSEPPSYCEAIYAKGFEVWKAFSVSEDFDFELLVQYQSVCDKFLFDAKGVSPGGNGVAFEWSILQNYAGERPFILAGGIGPEHAKILRDSTSLEDLKSTGLCGFDINSRFETAPGIKDINLVKTFKNELYR